METTKTHRKPRQSNSKRIDRAAPASIVIEKFGGLSRFCEINSKATSTVWRWLLSGDIPIWHIPAIKEKAAKNKVKVRDSDFIRQAGA